MHQKHFLIIHFYIFLHHFLFSSVPNLNLRCCDLTSFLNAARSTHLGPPPLHPHLPLLPRTRPLSLFFFFLFQHSTFTSCPSLASCRRPKKKRPSLSLPGRDWSHFLLVARLAAGSSSWCWSESLREGANGWTRTRRRSQRLPLFLFLFFSNINRSFNWLLIFHICLCRWARGGLVCLPQRKSGWK